MDTKQEILRRFFREFDSIRKIARDLQIGRPTVKKYLGEHQRAEQVTSSGSDPSALQEFLISNPGYDTNSRFRRKLNDDIERLIDEQLADNARKRQEGLRKQIKLKVDIYEFILHQGHQIGYTTVCNFIRDKELRQREAYIKQVYHPGEECEFDWAEVKLVIDGVRRRFFMAVFTSAYSNYRYSRLYNRNDTLAYMEAHNDFFAHIDGVFQEMVYDNMRVTIRDFVGRSEKTPTQALLNLSGWFQFRWRFCNARRGNEKGHVERSVEYVRRKAFCKKDDFATLEQAQLQIEQTCQDLNDLPIASGIIPKEGLAQERTALWKYPGTMECFITHEVKVDKYSTICFGTNRYSVPDHLIGRMVGLKAYTNGLKVYYSHQLVCTHDRNYGKNQWTISLDHYLKTLSRKPGALNGSLALAQAPEAIRVIYDSWFTNCPRDFVALLQFCNQHEVMHQDLLDKALYVNAICPGNVTAEKIMAVLGNHPPETGDMTHGHASDEIEDFANRQLEEISGLIHDGKETAA